MVWIYCYFALLAIWMQCRLMVCVCIFVLSTARKKHSEIEIWNIKWLNTNIWKRTRWFGGWQQEDMSGNWCKSNLPISCGRSDYLLSRRPCQRPEVDLSANFGEKCLSKCTKLTTRSDEVIWLLRAIKKGKILWNIKLCVCLFFFISEIAFSAGFKTSALKLSILFCPPLLQLHSSTTVKYLRFGENFNSNHYVFIKYNESIIKFVIQLNFVSEHVNSKMALKITLQLQVANICTMGCLQMWPATPFIAPFSFIVATLALSLVALKRIIQNVGGLAAH